MIGEGVYFVSLKKRIIYIIYILYYYICERALSLCLFFMLKKKKTFFFKLKTRNVSHPRVLAQCPYNTGIHTKTKLFFIYILRWNVYQSKSKAMNLEVFTSTHPRITSDACNTTCLLGVPVEVQVNHDFPWVVTADSSAQTQHLTGKHPPQGADSHLTLGANT